MVAMVSRILEFADQFPVVAYDPDRLEPPQVDLISYLVELFEILGYSEAHIHHAVEREIPEDAFEPADIEFRGSLTYPVYIAEDADASAHLVGYEAPIIPPLSEHGLDHADYERMRVYHEVADAEVTVCLTPFDLLVYEGRPLYAGNPPVPPVTSYPLWEDFDSELANDLQSELGPPPHLG